MFFFFSSRRRHTRFDCDWSSDVCSSDLFFDQRDAFAEFGGLDGGALPSGAGADHDEIVLFHDWRREYIKRRKTGDTRQKAERRARNVRRRAFDGDRADTTSTAVVTVTLAGSHRSDW